MFDRFNILPLAAGLAAVIALPGTAQAANANATARAKVVKPLVMTGGQILDLGTIVTPSTATYSGTFVVDAAASQTSTFCASGFVCSGTVKSAMFNLTGSNNNNITLNVPTTVTLTLQGASGTPPTITLTTRNSYAATNSATGNYTITLPNSGSTGVNFYVGGSLTINETVADGTYQGTFTVTADYQ